MTDENESVSVLSEIPPNNDLEIDEHNQEHEVPSLTDQGKGASPICEIEISPTPELLTKNNVDDRITDVEAPIDSLNVNSSRNSCAESSLVQLVASPQDTNGDKIVEELNFTAEDPVAKTNPSPDQSSSPAALADLIENSNEDDSLNPLLTVVSGRPSLASLSREAPDIEEEDYEDEEVVDSLRKPTSSSLDTKDLATDLQNSHQSPEKTLNSHNSNESTTKVHEKRQEKANQKPKETRGVGYMVEGPERVDASIESRYPLSDLVYIRCLVRPFTVGQLTHMIESHFGKPAELWLDKIKSSAVVRMENMDVAKRCREGLDGCRWPSINPRVLRCDFANEELFSWLKLHGDSGERPPSRNVISGLPTDKNDRISPDPNPNKIRRLPSKSDSHTLADSHSEKRRKLANLSTPSIDKVQYEQTKTSTKVEEPAKALDDLFKKTTTPPSIYWLPLTQEEADSQKKLRIERFSSESARRNAASRRNQGAMRETRSPFTGPAVKESSAINETINRKRLESNMPAAKEGRPTLQTDISGSKSSPVKSHRRERSPLTPKRRASPSPPTRGMKQVGEAAPPKSRSPAVRSRLSTKRRKNSPQSSPPVRVETRYRRSPPRNSPTRRDGKR